MYSHQTIALLLYATLCVATLSYGSPAIDESADQESFKLTILHNNDIHSRYMETSIYSSPCKDRAHGSKCFGGAARSVYLVKKIRSELGDDSVLYLNGGDHFQGTIWYNLFKWRAVSEFVVNMDYDALTLGNHEFDDGVAGVVPYIEHVQKGQWSNGSNSGHKGAPILVCNLDVSKEPEFNSGGRPIINSSMIITRKGRKIGLIGFITPDTSFLSSPGKTLTFTNEVDSVRREVAALQAMGVDIIIGISHAGYAADMNVAKNVPGIDIIVGGHTNTFLYTPGNARNEFDPHAQMRAPSIEEPLDSYPKVIEAKDGSKTLIVQAFAYGKYLGYLDVEFDRNGNVISYAGNPILLDGAIQEDAQTRKLMDKWSNLEPSEFKTIIGSSGVFLEGEDIVCRTRECSLGNLYSDMIVHYFMEYFGRMESKYSLSGSAHDSSEEDLNGWTRYPIAILNAGLIRTSIAPGEIAREDTMTVLPFKNEFEVIKIDGATLLKVLEHSVSVYDASGQRTEGRFLQFSGLKVVYDVQRPSGNRVLQVSVRCGRDCFTPKYEPLSLTKMYHVISSGYLDNGGDGYFMLNTSEKLMCPNCPAGDSACPLCSDIEIMDKYVQKWSPLVAEIEGRITLITSSGRRIRVDLSMIPGIFFVILLKLLN